MNFFHLRYENHNNKPEQEWPSIDAKCDMD